MDTMMARTATAGVITAVTPLSTAGRIARFPYYTNKIDDTLHVNYAQVGRTVGESNVSLVWYTQEVIAFPSMMGIGPSTPSGDTAADHCSSIQQPHTHSALRKSTLQTCGQQDRPQ